MEEFLSSLSQKDREEYTEQLIDILKTTDEPSKRNEIAIVLSEFAQDKAVEPIVQMINDPKTIGNRGTLLYSLRELEYSEHIELIFDLMFYKGCEVSRESRYLFAQALQNSNDKKFLSTWIEKIEYKIDVIEDDLDFLNFLTENIDIENPELTDLDL